MRVICKRKKFPCFWCFAVPLGLYDACLGMLNLRCLAMVFDLDETLIVANTMKSFEDRIEALRGWLSRETDPLRVQGMSSELKRYLEDRLLLKQYAESDTVVDNGKVYKVQMEEAPPLSGGHEKLVRPVVRLQERNIVLTRINPESATMDPISIKLGDDNYSAWRAEAVGKIKERNLEKFITREGLWKHTTHVQ